MIIDSVFIADDHPMYLSGFSGVLRDTFGCHRIDTFGKLNIARKEICKQMYDLYILDLEFEREQAFDLIALARDTNKEARVIVCTMHESLDYVDKLLSYKPNGILFKVSANVQNIIAAVETVMNGEEYLCPRTRILKPMYAQEMKYKSAWINLTDKELEIGLWLIHGYNTREIAERCSISENTVEAHKKSMADKLGGNMANMAAKLVHYGLIDYDEKKKKKRL